MEHLDNVLARMGATYRQGDFSGDIFSRVHTQIQYKTKQHNFFKTLGIGFMIFFVMAGILTYHLFPVHGIDRFLSVYIYVFFTFSLMTFIVIAVINTQSFFFKLFGHNKIKKLNREGCYFSEEGKLFHWKKV